MIPVTKFAKLVLEVKWLMSTGNVSAPKILFGLATLVFNAISPNTLILIPRGVSAAPSIKSTTCRPKCAPTVLLLLQYSMVHSVWHALIINTITQNTKPVKTVKEVKSWIRIRSSVNVLRADFGLATSASSVSIPNTSTLKTDNVWAAPQIKLITCWRKNVNFVQLTHLSSMAVTVELVRMARTSR